MALDLAQKWLQNCLENHMECGGNRDATPIPPRLLDLRQCRVRLKSIPEVAQSKESYVALSYCCPSGESVCIPLVRQLIEATAQLVDTYIGTYLHNVRM